VATHGSTQALGISGGWKRWKAHTPARQEPEQQDSAAGCCGVGVETGQASSGTVAARSPACRRYRPGTAPHRVRGCVIDGGVVQAVVLLPDAGWRQQRLQVPVDRASQAPARPATSEGLVSVYQERCVTLVGASRRQISQREVCPPQNPAIPPPTPTHPHTTYTLHPPSLLTALLAGPAAASQWPAPRCSAPAQHHGTPHCLAMS
jgi:hypothetical protein